jgi:hypothetical protein
VVRLVWKHATFYKRHRPDSFKYRQPDFRFQLRGIHYRLCSVPDESHVYTEPAYDCVHGCTGENCYRIFEAHVGCIIFDHEEAKLSRVIDDLDVHLSKNFFKKKDDGRLVKMITMRKYDGLYDDFTQELDRLKTRLSANNIEFEKVITEFSIYDTKVSHDFLWTENLEIDQFVEVMNK